MAPPLLFDLADIDLDKVQYGVDAVEAVNPHRGAMRMIDGVIHLSEGFDRAVAFRDIRDDEFWVTGHIPGRPLFPAVLMIETAAQVSSFAALKHLGEAAFLGFVGADGFKFRGQIVPGDRLIVLALERKFSRRRVVSDVQGLVDGNLVFEGTVTAMPI